MEETLVETLNNEKKVTSDTGKEGEFLQDTNTELTGILGQPSTTPSEEHASGKYGENVSNQVLANKKVTNRPLNTFTLQEVLAVLSPGGINQFQNM
jgi:hypothetical protein